MPSLLLPKPYLTVPDLVQLMHSRSMQIEDVARAERKLAQMGYYRLSGFWFPCRQYRIGDNGQVTVTAQTGKPLRAETMLAGTSFEKVFELYLFDKRLRLLMLDALERVEIFVRTALANELGYHNPMAYEDAGFIRPEQTRDYTDKQGKRRNTWADWTRRQQDQLSRCHEDHVLSHRHKGRAIPIWVAVEAWDFGTVSKYFELLNGRWQNRVCERLGVGNAKVLRNWLQELNTLRPPHPNMESTIGQAFACAARAIFYQPGAGRQRAQPLAWFGGRVGLPAAPNWPIVSMVGACGRCDGHKTRFARLRLACFGHFGGCRFSKGGFWLKKSMKERR